MTSGYIGSPSGNVLVPVTNFTKQTKWLTLVKTTDITMTSGGGNLTGSAENLNFGCVFTYFV